MLLLRKYYCFFNYNDPAFFQRSIKMKQILISRMASSKQTINPRCQVHWSSYCMCIIQQISFKYTNIKIQTDGTTLNGQIDLNQTMFKVYKIITFKKITFDTIVWQYEALDTFNLIFNRYGVLCYHDGVF